MGVYFLLFATLRDAGRGADIASAGIAGVSPGVFDAGAFIFPLIDGGGAAGASGASSVDALPLVGDALRNSTISASASS